jgi:hypothetical protein
MPVILATWETQIGGMVVPGQPKQKKFMRHPHLFRKKLGMVVHACHPSYCGKHKLGGSWSRPAWAKWYLKNNQREKGKQ